MQQHVREAVDAVIPFVDAVGAIVIVTGVVVTFLAWLRGELHLQAMSYEAVRLRLGRYLALALEFQLGADILATAVTPSFEEIGKLGAIAAIRTALNIFLSRELAAAAHPEPEPAR
jgi:uncharacterized membrane protein